MHHAEPRPLTEQPTILVAEDDLATRALLRATLERADYRVCAFEDGASALAEILRQPPDVALLDIGLPDLDGLAVTRAVRATPASALLPIILVTARGRLEDKIAGLDAGASDFITKPFEPVELLARVRANLRLSSALAKLETTQDVLVALANAVDAKDPMTEHHCGRVADLALVLARLASLDDNTIEAIAYGAVLHDVGKIGVPEAILLKPGLLTAEERIEMERHTLVGANILAPLRLGQLVGPIVRGHHERWDGTGYPDRLRGEEIPIGARIVAITDAHDAMTHDRTYRSRMDDEEAREELLRNAGSQFDPELVALFLAHLDKAPAAVVDPFTRGLRGLARV